MTYFFRRHNVVMTCKQIFELEQFPLITSFRNFSSKSETTGTNTEKKSSDKKSKKPHDGGGKSSERDAIAKFIEVAEAAKRLKIKFSEEEAALHAKIAKEYQVQCSKRHNRLEKDMATKIWLQQEALRALPPALRAAAEIIDHEPPPKDRPVAIFDTPPIKDFDINNVTYKSTE